jgi:hypothetical protein
MCIVPETLKQILDGRFRKRSWIMGVSFLPIASKETCTASATVQTKEICTLAQCACAHRQKKKMGMIMVVVVQVHSDRTA